MPIRNQRPTAKTASDSLVRIAEVCAALGHPVRVRIAILLLENETANWAEIHKAVGGHSKGAIQHHLDRLLSERIVIQVERGKYGIDEEAADSLKQLLHYAQAIASAIDAD